MKNVSTKDFSNNFSATPVLKNRQLTAAIHNEKQSRLKHSDGLRCIQLKKNRLTDAFLLALENCLMFDGYLKSFDFSYNLFSYDRLKNLIKSECLTENNSLINFNISYNPGTTNDVRKSIALQLLKNISILQ